jgi:HAD superfamily phosphoserine phosphatase-like hydrolase
MKRLFLYDFDGTITTKDSLFDFLKFSTSSFSYYLGFCVFLPLFLGAKLKFFQRAEVKRRFISFFLKGKSKDELTKLSQGYLEHILNGSMFRETALHSIREHKKEGEAYLVSASLDIWLTPIANWLDIGLICTKASYSNDIFNGHFSTPNCNYDEKVRRVIEEIKMEDYQWKVYYGDSNGDLAMKNLVDEYHHQLFN